jgi:hypothetical protein
MARLGEGFDELLSCLAERVGVGRGDDRVVAGLV